MPRPKKLPWCQYDTLEEVEIPLADKPIRVKCGNGLYMEISCTVEGVEIRMSGNVWSGQDRLITIPVVSNVIEVMIANVTPTIK